MSVELICHGLAIIIVLTILGFVVNHFIPLNLWFEAKTNGLPIDPFLLLSMRLRKIDPYVIVKNAIKLKKEGIDVDFSLLESHFMANGNVVQLTDAMIMAKRAGVAVNKEFLTAIDLAGYNPVETVKEIIAPKDLEVDNFICKSQEGKEYKVGFSTRVQLCQNGCPLTLGHTLEYLKNFINDYIYKLDSSKNVDATEINKAILENDFEKKNRFIIHDIKVYVQMI